MYCPSCKRYRGKGNDFCKKCGAYIPLDDSDVSLYADYECNGYESPDNKPDSRKYSRIPDTQNINIQKILQIPNMQSGSPDNTFQKTLRQLQEQINTNQTGTTNTRTGTKNTRTGTTKQRQSTFAFLLFFIFIFIFIFFVALFITNNDVEYENTPVYVVSQPDFIDHNYTLGKPEITPVISADAKKVNSFSVKYKDFNDDNGNTVLQPGLTAKGYIVIDGSTEYDVYLKNNVITVPACSIDVASTHAIDFFIIDFEENTYTLYMPHGFTDITFLSDGTVKYN